MKVLIQRVKNASVTIDGKLFSSINQGLLALVGIEKGDTIEAVQKLAKKVVNLRIFSAITCLISGLNLNFLSL